LPAWVVDRSARPATRPAAAGAHVADSLPGVVAPRTLTPGEFESLARLGERHLAARVPGWATMPAAERNVRLGLYIEQAAWEFATWDAMDGESGENGGRV
jgi:hypothetical protein